MFMNRWHLWDFLSLYNRCLTYVKDRVAALFLWKENRGKKFSIINRSKDNEDSAGTSSILMGFRWIWMHDAESMCQ